MRLATKAALVSLVAQILFATQAHSAEFDLVKSRYGFQIVTLDGPINKGDAERFRAIMQRAILTLGVDRLIVSLDSVGGSIGEAVEIGRIVRATLAETRTASTDVWSREFKGEVGHWRIESDKLAFANLDEPLPELSKCWSACTIIFYSGVVRTVTDNVDKRTNDILKRVLHPTIGVHRPSYDPGVYGQLSPSEAQKAYDLMLQNMSKALAEMGAPSSFIKKTMATPSREIDLIPSDQMEHFVAPTAPFFETWLEAKCGRLTDTLANQEDRSLYTRYQQWILGWTENGDFLKDDWDEDVALVEEFGLLDAVRAKELSVKVERWRRWVDLCSEVTVRTVRHKWATETR